ncbi:hypothetical protein I551_5514 [Mycobacterium ulcerans str. Harvey]|uniref:Uncharacterized protein n=1 Tax=Mycobacterium ulcerans str. Harvey TaxID=1299332 RepID=A0ABP3AEP0_MYCUL|nr:hypothetical protein I551_5514 [Mycobacterium ulcerans str. Harvey]
MHDREFVAEGGPVEPHHGGQVDEVEWIANLGRHGIDVELGSVEYFTYSQRAQTVSVLGPTVVLTLIGIHHFLGDVIDVAEGDLLDAAEYVQDQALVQLQGADLSACDVEYRLVSQPIGAHQRVHRHLALCQAPCVLECGCWRLDVFDSDPVADGGEDRLDIRPDAVMQQSRQQRVLAQFADFADHLGFDRVDKRSHQVTEPRDDFDRPGVDGVLLAVCGHAQTL